MPVFGLMYSNGNSSSLVHGHMCSSKQLQYSQRSLFLRKACAFFFLASRRLFPMRPLTSLAHSNRVNNTRIWPQNRGGVARFQRLDQVVAYGAWILRSNKAASGRVRPNFPNGDVGCSGVCSTWQPCVASGCPVRPLGPTRHSSARPRLREKERADGRDAQDAGSSCLLDARTGMDYDPTSVAAGPAV